MSFLNYTTGIPDTPNDPSEDQPDMKINNDSNEAIWKIDHYGFNNNNGGLHKYVRMPYSAPGSIPPGLVPNEGTIYPKSVTSDGSARTQLFFTPDASTNQYQLTRTIATKFATFSTATVYDGTQPDVTGGWTFLPGGMLLQYGILANPTNNATIKYPVAFTSFAFITLGAVRNNTDDKTISVKDGSSTITQFQIIMSNSSLPTALYWHSIGK
jgi:hypothetical protein